MKFLTRAFLVGLLQVLGFAAISYAIGMWLLPLGIVSAGVSLLLLAALVERGRDDPSARR